MFGLGPTGLGPGPRRLPVGSRHSLDPGGSGGAEPAQEEQSDFFVLLRCGRGEILGFHGFDDF